MFVVVVPVLICVDFAVDVVVPVLRVRFQDMGFSVVGFRIGGVTGA